MPLGINCTALLSHFKLRELTNLQKQLSLGRWHSQAQALEPISAQSQQIWLTCVHHSIHVACTICCTCCIAFDQSMSPRSLMSGGVQIHWVTGRRFSQDHAVRRYLRLPSRQHQQDWQAEAAVRVRTHELYHGAGQPHLIMLFVRPSQIFWLSCFSLLLSQSQASQIFWLSCFHLLLTQSQVLYDNKGHLCVLHLGHLTFELYFHEVCVRIVQSQPAFAF